jgi:hypothetical protein
MNDNASAGVRRKAVGAPPGLATSRFRVLLCPSRGLSPPAFAFVLGAAFCCFIFLAPSRDSVAADKPLTRAIDPVVLVAAKVPGLLGVEISRLGLFAVRGETLAPVPFQIDQRRGAEYLFQNGRAASRDFGRGGLQSTDEIAFLAADSGSRLTTVAWPAGASAGVEITLHDPVDGGAGYLYLLAFSGAAIRSAVRYVAYRRDRDEVETADYIVGYGPEAPISISKLCVKAAAGGSGQNVADRQKIRIEGVSVWNLIHFSRNENDFHSEVIAYTVGPVRMLRKTRNWLTLFWRIPSPSVQLTSVYWKTGMFFPIRLVVPFRVARFFREARLRLYIDSSPLVAGRVFYNDRNPGGALIDGAMDETEKRLDRRPAEWQVVAGTRPEHREAWFSRQIYDPRCARTPATLFYLDDRTVLDGPERYPGCFGCLGFEMDGLAALDAGSFTIDVQMFPMPAYRAGDERAYLDMTDRPLAVVVEPWPPPR